MTVVYLLKRDPEAKWVFARNKTISEDYGSKLSGERLAKELENSEVCLGVVDEFKSGDNKDFYMGVQHGSFSANMDVCRRMELNKCPDVNLIDFILSDNGEPYCYLSVTNIIDVRFEAGRELELPVVSDLNKRYRIDPNHPKLNRTMLFTMPTPAPNVLNLNIGLLFYASVNGSTNDFDFLDRYLTLGLTGINAIEVCRS